jgi:hypothetical protein
VCENLPQHGINATHWEYTLERFKLYENVIFLNDWMDSFNRFASDVGWKLLSAEDSHVKKNAASAKQKERKVEMLHNWDENMSMLDDALYAYARAIYDDQPQPPPLPDNVWQVNGAGNNPCTTPCCGPYKWKRRGSQIDKMEKCTQH